MSFKMNRRSFFGGATSLTGALLLPGLVAQSAGAKTTSENVKYIASVCLNCTQSCGIVVKVKDGRALKVDGNILDPNTQGTICAKGQAALNNLYDPDRIVYPLKRVGKRGAHEWKRISWDQALSEVAEKLGKLKDTGKEEEFIFHHGRSKLGSLKKRFCHAFGTPNDLNHTSICSNNIRRGLNSFWGNKIDFDSSDYANTKYILNFGSNFYECHQGGHYISKRAMRGIIDNEAKLVTFDVRLSNTAAKSDEWHAPFPGTDGAVALAMGNVIMAENLYDGEFINGWTTTTVEELKKAYREFTAEWAEKISGVSATTIVRIAREFAMAAPRAIACHNRGGHAHSNGFYSSRAFITLNAMVGSVGKAGGFQYSLNGKHKEWGIKLIDPRPFPPKPEKKSPVAHPPEYPYSWAKKVGGNNFLYWKQKRAKVSVYMGYCVNAAYTWPEGPSLAREVLMDEELIPFHVAIDAFYSEQASLADIILPDGVFLEKHDHDQWDAYDYVPYVGLRQPVGKPLGEAKDVREILHGLANRVGRGMEKYFDWVDTEDYMRKVFAKIPRDEKGVGGFDRMKRDGVYKLEGFPENIHPDFKGRKGYEFFKWGIPKEKLKHTYVETDELPNGKRVDYIKQNESKKVFGVMVEGKACYGFHRTKTRLFEIYQEDILKAGKVARNLDGTKLSGVYKPLPTYFHVPGHKKVKDDPDQFILTSFKVNVHTQSRTANQKWLTEIWHDNPMWINRRVGEKLGLKEGSEVVVTTWRLPYRAFWDKDIPADGSKVGELKVKAHLTDAIHPKTIAISTSSGHWEYGRVAQAKIDGKTQPSRRFTFARPDKDIDESVWWSEEKKGKGNGVHPNSIFQINPDPISGQQGWFDNIATIRKI